MRWAERNIPKVLLQSAVILVSTAAIPALADELQIKAPPPSPTTHNWTGFYGGYNVGAAFGSYDARTTATPGGTYLVAPADIAAVNAAGGQSIRPIGFTGGVQAGYNWQSGHWLLGIETDLDFVHLNGAANGPAVPYAVGTPFGANEFSIHSDANIDWLYTLRPRVGYAQNNWLFYVTGGLALTSLQGNFVYADGVTPLGASLFLQSARLAALTAGYTFGAGVEVALTGRLSVKAEVLDVRFPDGLASQTSAPVLFGVQQSFRQSLGLHADLARVGLNYRFGGPEQGPDDLPILPFKALPQKAFSDWAVEVGARTWLSSGRYGAPQPLIDLGPPDVVSRLTFSNLDSLSGEAFGRVDHASGFFLKGYVGGGGINQGHLNDEDFPDIVAYSNTVSSAFGHIGYATIDAGYNFLKGPDAKVGAFVGYNYYAQAIDAAGCTQIAGDAECNPQPFGNVTGITDNNAFNSLRIGLSSEVTLADRLKLTGEVAYVPLVNFGGLDYHLARQTLLAEASSNGNGVMLESILSYDVTDHFNIGIGGRYWAWNMNTGTAANSVLSQPGPPAVAAARYNAERYGVFLQSSYRWGNATPLAARDAVTPSKAVPANWTGFYAGGHLGGAASDDRWSDPFGSTDFFGLGFTNVAGFGDTTHATGPLGGFQAGYNLQAGNWVYGVQADISAADVKGENTCFSGIDGLNCQRIVNSIRSFTGRLGYAWGGALVYAKGGAALIKTTYNVDGNTPLQIGTGSATVTEWGWIAGVGLEYAFSNRWSTFIEYDHIGLNDTTVAFPTVDFASVAVVNVPSFSIRQNIDMVKLGINYNFGGSAIARN